MAKTLTSLYFSQVISLSECFKSGVYTSEGGFAVWKMGSFIKCVPIMRNNMDAGGPKLTKEKGENVPIVSCGVFVELILANLTL